MNKKIVYQFDVEGILINTFENPDKASEQLKTSSNTIRAAINRKSCVGSKYYLSYSKDFKIPIKKINSNPLLSKTYQWKNPSTKTLEDLFLQENEDFMDY
jgi:hypothetical protein